MVTKKPRTLASFASAVAARERPRASLPAAVLDDQKAPVARVVPIGAKVRKVGKAILGYLHKPAKKTNWTKNAQRLAETERLIVFRVQMAAEHGQLFDVREEDYLAAVLPELILEAGMPNRPISRANAVTWATQHLPALLDRHDLEWFDRLEAEFIRLHRRLKPLRADAIAKLLRVTWDERQECGLTTIGAIDMDKRQRRKERKKRHAARGREKRAVDGATPRAESLARVKPWEREGISRAAWYRLRKPAETNSCATLQAGSETSSCAIELAAETNSCAPYIPIRRLTDSSQAGFEQHTKHSDLRHTETSGIAIKASRSAIALLQSSDAIQLTLLPPSQERTDLEVACAAWPARPTYAEPNPVHPNEMPDAIRVAYIAAKRRRVMSQSAIAKVIGISRPQVANAIHAKRRRARRLPNAFDLSPEVIEKFKEWLLADDPPREPDTAETTKPAKPHHRKGGKRPPPDPTPPLPGLRLFTVIKGDGERREEPRDSEVAA